MLHEKHDQKIKKFEKRLDKNKSISEQGLKQDVINILVFVFILGCLFLLGLDF